MAPLQGGDRQNYKPKAPSSLAPSPATFRTVTSPLVGGQFIAPFGTNGLPL